MPVFRTPLQRRLHEKRHCGDVLDRKIQCKRRDGTTASPAQMLIWRDGKPCASIGSADLVAFAKEKLKTGVTPQTVSNYLSHLSAIFTLAGPAWNIPLDAGAMLDALIVC
ncbi:MAG: hypothetical protein ACXIU8_10255 [Alkalilacustris sp.]